MALVALDQYIDEHDEDDDAAGYAEDVVEILLSWRQAEVDRMNNARLLLDLLQVRLAAGDELQFTLENGLNGPRELTAHITVTRSINELNALQGPSLVAVTCCPQADKMRIR